MYLFSSTTPPPSIPKISLSRGLTTLGMRNDRTLFIQAVTAEVSKPRVGWPRISSLLLIVRQLGPVRLCSWQVDADHSNVVIAQFLGSSQSIDPHLERRGISCVKRAQKRPRILALFIFL